MANMFAAYLTGHGGNEVVTFGERPVPQRRAGEVLVEMQAGGLNRVDLYMRNSGAGITHSLPQVLGLDGFGRVVDADDDSRLSKGARVVLHPATGCGVCEFCRRGEHPLCVASKYLGEHRDGTLSQFVCLPAENVFPAPKTLDGIEAAALGVAPITAWRMVFTKAKVQPWETVLIFGIGGTVSVSALQLVKGIGARAIVTSRDSAKLEKATALGADATINSRSEDISKKVMALTGGRGVDVVIENVGEAVWSHALKSLVRGGRLVTCGATSGGAPSADLQRMFIRQLTVMGSTHGSFEEFRQMLAMVDAGGFRPVIDSRFAIEDIHAALDRLDTGQQFGKVGIQMPA
jgi:NADPH:quinone reductase-like Zn-dependent oxidoreductase